jgi:hypothetical protein
MWGSDSQNGIYVVGMVAMWMEADRSSQAENETLWLCYKTSSYQTPNYKTPEIQNVELQNADYKTSKVTKGRITKRRITKRRKLQKVEKQKVESNKILQKAEKDFFIMKKKSRKR